jgi:hypothetical protein
MKELEKDVSILFLYVLYAIIVLEVELCGACLQSRGRPVTIGSQHAASTRHRSPFFANAGISEERDDAPSE